MLLRGRWAGCTSHAVFQVCTFDTFWFSYWRLKEDYSWKPLFSAWIWETDSTDMTVDSDWKCHIIFIFFLTYFFLPEENAVGLFWSGPFYLYSMRVLGPFLSLFLGTRFLGMHCVMKMLLSAAQVYCYPWRNFSLHSPFFFLVEELEGDWSIVVDQAFRKWAKKTENKKKPLMLDACSWPWVYLKDGEISFLTAVTNSLT